jgi:hypothetical protein
MMTIFAWVVFDNVCSRWLAGVDGAGPNAEAPQMFARNNLGIFASYASYATHHSK